METELYPPESEPVAAGVDAALAPLREVEASAFQARIRLGERIYFVGHTGSGKTTLAQAMLERLIPRRIPIVVIDPKGEFQPSIGQGWEIRDDLPWNWERITASRRRPKHLRIIIRPEFLADHRKDARLNTIYARIYDRKGTLVYLDEIQRLTREHLSAPELARLVQMGRSRRVSVWGSTLRPSGIPRYFTSESDHVFTFRLRDELDRRRIAQIIGPRGLEHPGPGPHDFFYRPPGVDMVDPILVHQ